MLIKNIKQLFPVVDPPVERMTGRQMREMKCLENAWLEIREDRIYDFGRMSALSDNTREAVDATGRVVMPAFCDSHTHLVFAGSREQEFVDKIQGLTYEEIARRGGGILNSAHLLRQTTENELFRQSAVRLQEIIGLGTGAVEIKSGYGLSLDAELKMLRVIHRLAEQYPVTIKSTFLGAHAVPGEYKDNPDKYVDLVIREMIPAIGKEKLADYIDVFCDQGFFTPAQTAMILEAAAKYGLVPKIHANELGITGGVQVGVQHNALSVDHLENTGEEEINTLKNSRTMPCLLPGTSFFLGIPYAPARKMIDEGLGVALASDFNPGSSPSGNMQLILSLACIHMKLLPEEAIIATTLNGAYAMGVETELGSITRGKKANLIITKAIPGYEFLPYSFGSNKVDKMILNGKIIK
jgi:imidazolonepropionase